MIGLKTYDRDLELVQRAGDGDLAAPSLEQLLQWVGQHLLRPGEAEPESGRWTFARWKPGVSLTLACELQLADGSLHLVCLRRYSSERVKAGEARRREAGDGPLQPWAQVPGEPIVLSTPAGDRSLPGLALLERPGRLARTVEEAGLVEPYRLKARSSEANLLRYKPGRRAVLAYDADLHRPAPKPRTRRFALRLHPLAAMARILAAREELDRLAERDAPWPRLAHGDRALGLLLEPWLAGSPAGPEGQVDPALAAAPLVQLHQVAAPDSVLPHRPRPSSLAPLFAFDPSLAQEVAGAEAEPQASPTGWIHGDLHGDQVLLDPAGRPLLLDLDELRLGRPEQDLADWIADALALDADRSLASASAELLDPYRTAGGARPDPEWLRAWVRLGLLRRAAASLRRLEQDAEPRARRLLERAARLDRELLP